MSTLTPDDLINGYAAGYFPMAEPDEGNRIYWYRPQERALLPIEDFHVPRRLARTIRQGLFETHLNRDFEAVIRGCAENRETWLSEELIQLFLRLHQMGLAHSVGCYEGTRLVGGVYGLALGTAFFAESMFHRKRDASKVALVRLVEILRSTGFTLLDAQFENDHLLQFGLFLVDEAEYEERLGVALGLDG